MNENALKVLYIGGTGIISTSCVRQSCAEGMRVFVLNRGRNVKGRQLPGTVTWLEGDVSSPAALAAALGDQTFDCVVNFQSFDASSADAAIQVFRDRTRQYIHISSASIYRKPVVQTPIVESTLRFNEFAKYSRDKIAAEDRLMEAYLHDGFPVTIVRPTHTYDESNPPLPGDWTILDRMERGAEIIVPGDGTSLWTLTHAADLAQGLVGLIANPRAIGEAFHITSDDVYTWDQIYTIIGEALGVEVHLIHVTSEFISLAAPDWFWSELIIGDLAHSAVFDNSKIRRAVPAYMPHMTFHRSIRDLLEWRTGHPDVTAPDPTINAILDRLAAAYHAARDVFVSFAPEAG